MRLELFKGPGAARSSCGPLRRRRARISTAGAWTLAVALSLLTWTAQADDCVANFRTGKDPTTQAELFSTSVRVPGMDTRGTIGQLKSIAEHDGFQVDKVDYETSGGRLELSQKASSTARGFPILITARKPGDVVTIAAALPPGMHAEPDAIRTNMCGMLARIDAPGGAKAADDPRTAPPSTQKKLNVLKPADGFDAAAAKAALTEGTGVIAGTACVLRAGATSLASNQTVLLFPATPYLQEVVALMHKAKPGRDTLDLDPEAMRTRLEGKTNGKGQFRFAKMKPGRYYLLTTLGSTRIGSRNVSVGTGVQGNTIIDYYETQYFANNYDDVLEKFVTLGEGQTREVTLTPRRKWTVLLGDNNGAAGIFGCDTHD